MDNAEVKTKSVKEGTRQAMQFRKTVRNIVRFILGGVVALAVTVWTTQLIHTNNQAKIDGEGSNQSAVSVSTGPRCDGSKTYVFSRYLSGRPGCLADWNISDTSPNDCVMILDLNQKPIRPVCRGEEMEVAGITMTGWRADFGKVSIDITYTELPTPAAAVASK